MNRNSNLTQIKKQDQRDFNHLFTSNLSFSKIISDIENYQQVVRGKIENLKIEINHKYKYQEYLTLIDRLDVLKKRLTRFDRFEKNWLHEKKLLASNQSEVIKNTINSIKEEAVFAKQQVEKTLDDIYTITFDVVEINNRMIFDEIVICLDRVIQASDRILYKMESWNNIVSSSPIFELATLVGARFVPLKQNMNPWAPTNDQPNDGNGKGHQQVLRWRDDILKTGKYLAQVINDNIVMKKNNNQKDNKETYLYEFISHSLPELRAKLNKCLHQLDDHKIYRLTVHNGFARCGGIALGLRKLAHDELEFFDPIKGLFIFPDNESFRIWFSQFLSIYLLNKPAINISLFEIGKQPSHSMPTIPIIKTFNGLAQFDYENTSIKEKIIKSIDDEIANLKGSWSYQSPKIMPALEVLKTRINDAGHEMTLTGIVQSWLLERDPLGTKTYREIIKGHSIFRESSTSRLITGIISNREINPERMDKLQKKMIEKILLMIQTKTYPMPTPLLFEEIKQLYLNKNFSQNELLTAIKLKVIHLQFTAGLFTPSGNSEDQDVKIFCSLMNKLDQHDPYSLIKTAIVLGELIDTIAFKNEQRYAQINIENNVEIAPKMVLL